MLFVIVSCVVYGVVVCCEVMLYPVVWCCHVGMSDCVKLSGGSCGIMLYGGVSLVVWWC